MKSRGKVGSGRRLPGYDQTGAHGRGSGLLEHIHSAWGNISESSRHGWGWGSAYIQGNHSRKLRTGDDRMALKTVYAVRAVPSPDRERAATCKRVLFAKDSSACLQLLIYCGSTLMCPRGVLQV